VIRPYGAPLAGVLRANSDSLSQGLFSPKIERDTVDCGLSINSVYHGKAHHARSKRALTLGEVPEH
jgi:hypothetical protein